MSLCGPHREWGLVALGMRAAVAAGTRFHTVLIVGLLRLAAGLRRWLLGSSWSHLSGTSGSCEMKVRDSDCGGWESGAARWPASLAGICPAAPFLGSCPLVSDRAVGPRSRGPGGWPSHSGQRAASTLLREPTGTRDPTSRWRPSIARPSACRLCVVVQRELPRMRRHPDCVDFRLPLVATATPTATGTRLSSARGGRRWLQSG